MKEYGRMDNERRCGMTEKRFTYEYDEYNGNLFDNKMNTFYHIEDSEENIELLCDRLNWLVEENEQLKQQLEDCKTYNATLYANNIKSDRMLVNDIKELRKENEELKQQINTMINELQTEKETAISRNERIRLDFAITVLEELR